MMFNVPGHIQMIKNGLDLRFTDEKGKPLIIIKTETRRLNRGIYQVGKDYAVQRKRGVKAEQGIRIVMDRIWEEKPLFLLGADDKKYPAELIILKSEAWAEGGYTPLEFDEVFRKLNPNWDGRSRWAFKFHVIKVRI